VLCCQTIPSGGHAIPVQNELDWAVELTRRSRGRGFHGRRCCICRASARRSQRSAASGTSSSYRQSSVHRRLTLFCRHQFSLVIASASLPLSGNVSALSVPRCWSCGVPALEPLTKRTANCLAARTRYPYERIVPAPSSESIFRRSHVASGPGCHPVDLTRRHLHRPGVSRVCGRGSQLAQRCPHCDSGSLRRPASPSGSTLRSVEVRPRVARAALEPLGSAGASGFCHWC
jgi:hypothetical protein